MGVGVRKHRSDEAKSFLVAIRPFVEAARVRLGKLRPLVAVARDLKGPVDMQGDVRPMSAGAIIDAIFVLQQSDKVKAKKLFVRSLRRECGGHMKKQDFNQRLQLYDKGIKPGVTPDGHVVTASTHIYVETINKLIESQTAKSEASIHAKLKKQFTLAGEYVRWWRHDVFENMNENSGGDSKDVKVGRIEIDGRQDRVGIVNRESQKHRKLGMQSGNCTNKQNQQMLRANSSEAQSQDIL
jgi:hypothetical protein